MFGDTFTDWADLAAPSVETVCAGCVSILAGRPGDDPPPLRTQHVLAVVGESARYPGTPELAAILRAPPSVHFVLAVAESRKRHAALRAGLSSADRIVVGLDDAPAVVTRADIPRLDAIESLLASFRRDDIIAGQYQAPIIAKHGRQRWEMAESLIADIRPSPLLRLLVTVARKPEATPDTESPMDIPHTEKQAAALIAAIAEHSRLRRKDGLTFWKSILPHRVNRFVSLPLREFAARLMTAVDVDPLGGASAVRVLGEIADINADSVQRALRTRTALILTLAYEVMRAEVETKREIRAQASLFQE